MSFPDKKSLCRVAEIIKLFPDGPALPGERHFWNNLCGRVVVRQRAVANGPNAFLAALRIRRIGFVEAFKTPEIGLLASHSNFSDVLTLSGHPHTFYAEPALNGS